MKTCFAMLILAAQSTLALAQNKEPYTTKALNASEIKAVFLNTSGGSITVSGAPGQSARLEVYITGNNGRELSREEIQKRLNDDYDLKIDVSGGELHASAKQKHNFNWGFNRGLSIAFKAYVPTNVDTKVSTSGGSIHMDNLHGTENFETSGGSLHVDHLTGMIKGETSGGSIEVAYASDHVDLETSGGSIHASDCHGQIRLETSGGSLTLEKLAGNIHAETSGGSIHADDIHGELVTGTSGGSINIDRMAGSVSAETSGGSVHANIIEAGKYVKLGASGGHVDLDLPAGKGYNLDIDGSHVDKPSNMSAFNGEWDKDHVKGTYNGGGIPVRVDAGSSHVNLRFN